MQWEKYHAQFYGVTQSGKTTLALSWLLSHSGVKIFIDTKNETATKKHWNKLFHFIAPLNDIDPLLKNFQQFVEKEMRIALVPSNSNLDSEMKEFCARLWNIKRTNTLETAILFDEIQEYECVKNIRSLFVQGLAKKLFCGFTSQGWSQVNKNIRNNCELSVFMKQRQNDIDSLMEQGLIPYHYDEKGWRVNELDFSRPYAAFAEIGMSGKLVKIQ